MKRLLKLQTLFMLTPFLFWGCDTLSERAQSSPNAESSQDFGFDSSFIDASMSRVDGSIQDVGCRPCPEGFQAEPDGCLCQDIDECSLGLCEGVCTNTTGSFDCVPDVDGDGIADIDDNCPFDINSDQADLDEDALGDTCDDDDDGDGVPDAVESELGTNPLLADTDADGVNDFFELQCTQTDDRVQCPSEAPDTLNTATPDALNPDVDQDGHLDGVDNCFSTPNVQQVDTDDDGIGDLCDDDADGDRVQRAADCDDTNPQVGALVFDQDCDGARELSSTIRSFSAGWQTTCGILASGELTCFGAADGSPPTPPVTKNGEPYRDWIEVSAGNNMACAIHENGRMDCFGARAPTPPTNERGQPFADWYTVDVGGDSTPYVCAIRANGQLYCFGQHRAFNPLQDELSSGRNWVSVAVGVRHGCARSGDGNVLCFGENNFGQGTPPQMYENRWIEMDGGYAHTCGRIDSGEMICFGINSDQQLDVPLTENETPILDWKSVSVGGFAGCGIRGDEEIVCWGSNYYGQILVPEVPQPWVGVSSGRYHTCGQLTDGTLKCWGWNSRGERDVPLTHIFKQSEPLDNCPGLNNPQQNDVDGDNIGDLCDDDRDGDGLLNTVEPSFGLDPDLDDTDGDGINDGIEFGCNPGCPDEPANTVDGSSIDALNADSDADGVPDENDNCRTIANPGQDNLDEDRFGDVCDIDIDGDGIRVDADCDDYDDRLGLSARDSDCDGIQNHPIPSRSLLVAGESVACIMDPSGAIQCAGQDHYEQTQIPQDPDGWPYRDWRSMDIAFSHGCATRLNGEMVCWGANYDGRASPPQFDGNGNEIRWRTVTTGFAHTCALSSDGRMYCFGGNYDGQCDVPLDPYTEQPYVFKTIDAGAFHTCGITIDDQLVCFGSRNSLQRPITVHPTHRFAQIAASREHSCALRLSGEIQCWARAGFMEIPTDAAGNTITDWVSLSAGRYHTCGIRSSGSVQCFGTNTDGQYGLETMDEGFIVVAAGGRYTCALDVNQTVHCAGDDQHDQVTQMQGRLAYENSGPDNCEALFNPDQTDENNNGIGDVCELE